MTFSELISSGKPVLVDFTATWCGPCKMMAPVLDQLKRLFEDRLTIIKIDIDKNPPAAQAFGIQGVPTLILFTDGKQQWRQSGVMTAQVLKGVIDQYVHQ
jgi:thioredoxin 1